MGLKQTIEEIVEKHLPDESHFVVDVEISEIGAKQRIKILIDADAGLNINTCAMVSRAVGEEIEAKEILDEAYILEVSSPGLDYPLTSRRQYEKNVGRSLIVTLEENREIEGILQGVDHSAITLKVKKKEKGKKATEEELKVALEQIRKSIVLVSFK
ncbi:MAG: ribosome maturation factor RimP [Anditalea sp.]